MAKMPSGVADTLLALAVVGLVLGGLYLYTGVWPPMVVVESGSMMHPDNEVPYGRFGTINPGDLVLVKSIQGPSDVSLWVSGGSPNYGEPGDVLVYFPGGDTSRVPVIHRAITWVTVSGEGTGRTYSFPWPADYDWGSSAPPAQCNAGTCTFGWQGVYFPPLGFSTQDGFRPDAGWQPPSSGWVTKGDNVVTNTVADQVSGISCPAFGEAASPGQRCAAVDPSWVEGVARGDLPWFGLLKLAIGGHPNVVNPPSGWVTILWASAPADLWVMLFVSLGVLVAIPVVFDLVRSRMRSARGSLERGGREAGRTAAPPPSPGSPASGSMEATGPAGPGAGSAGGGEGRGGSPGGPSGGDRRQGGGR